MKQTAREVIEDLYRSTTRKVLKSRWIKSALLNAGFEVGNGLEAQWGARLGKITWHTYSRKRDRYRAYRNVDLWLAKQLDQREEGGE